MSTRPLTTTSFAILGVLAMRPWSAYELTAYMRGSAVRALWPRTESRLYAEPKNLVAHGYARVKKEYTGKRGRSVYRITADGRRALSRWLGEASSSPQVADEALLKVFFADFGSVSDLRSTIRSAAHDLRAQIDGLRVIGDRFEEGSPLFPERVHVTALTATSAITSLRQRFELLRWLEAHVRNWEDTRLDEEKGSAAQALHEKRRAELEDLDGEIESFLDRSFDDAN